MQRLLGVTLLVLGSFPLLLAMAGWAMWIRHMSTVGLWPDTRSTFEVLLVAGLMCVGLGLYLIVRSRRFFDQSTQDGS